MKFTDKSIRALRPKSTRYEVWDEGKRGFGIRVTPRGVKSFIWMYRFEGKSKRLTLGCYPKTKLSDANIAFAAARDKLLNGSDPGTETVQQHKADRHAITVSSLVNEYLERHSRPNKRSAHEDERILNKDVLPRWGNLKAKKISKRDIITLIDDILARGSPISANVTLACIRKMYNWAISRDMIETNPCLSVRPPARATHRDRVLSSEEIYYFWHNIEKTAISAHIKLALKLQLVTAQRKGELLAAKWSDVDLNSKIWTIPIENSKNRLAHRVPLSDLACAILGDLKQVSGESAYLFPSKNGSIIRGSSIDHALRKKRDVLQIANVTPHDFRRTAASHMASLGVNRLVISKILNHVESSVTSIYDRYSYDSEKRNALDGWGRYLTVLIERKEDDKSTKKKNN